MIRPLLTTILFMFVLFKSGLSDPDLCRNPKIDSITYLSKKDMYFFTSGGYYWYIKKTDFPPQPNSGKPLPEGFKRGDAAVYKDTLTVCSATGKPAEQEIYVLEKTEKGNQILVLDTRTMTWSRPKAYNTDKTISVAQIDWNKNVDAIFTYKPTEMYFVQGIKISVIDFKRICGNPNNFAEPITIRPTDDIGTRHPVDAMTLIASDRLVYFTGKIYHEMKINTVQSRNGRLKVYKEVHKNISKDFFGYNECPEQPSNERPDENTSKITQKDPNRTNGSDAGNIPNPSTTFPDEIIPILVIILVIIIMFIAFVILTAVGFVNKDSFEGMVVGKNEFLIEKYLTKGSFGSVFVGKKISSNQRVVFKVELIDSDRPLLAIEYRFYRILGSGQRGIPKIHHFLPINDRYHTLIMDFLGPSLYTVHKKCDLKFSIITTTLIGLQLLDIFQYFHEKGLIHRDVKPGNFVFGVTGTSKYNKLYIIDLGHTKDYKDESGDHIQYIEGKELRGTARYTSINNHLGREQSRRDDLESIGYMFVYLFKGELPWQDISFNTKDEKWQRIKEIKVNTSVELLCEGMPEQFVEYLKTVKSLAFEEDPNYHKYIDLFKKALRNQGIHQTVQDDCYDFDINHKKVMRAISNQKQ